MADGHVRLDGHTVTSSYSEGAAGRRWRFEDIGQFRFFVTIVEPGGEIVVWSGYEYGEAIRVAESVRLDWSLTEAVLDCVVGPGNG